MASANDEEKKDDKKTVALDAGDIALLKTYGIGPYHASIKALEGDIESEMKKIQELVGVKESETGLAPQASWDIVSDKQMMNEEHPLRECGHGRERLCGTRRVRDPRARPANPLGPVHSRGPAAMPRSCCGARPPCRQPPGLALMLRSPYPRSFACLLSARPCRGGALHQDHQRWARGRQVHGQRAPVREVRRRARGQGQPDRH